MVFLLLILSIGSTFALETDNYLTWDMELVDSSEKINEYLNSEIEDALIDSTGLNCKDVTLKIAKKFKSTHPEKSPIEIWLKSHLELNQFFPTKDEGYIAKSIYRNPYRFYVPYFILSPNIQVNGIYFGTDKLIHFTSTGRRYFEFYQEKKFKGVSDEEAFKSMIEFGLWNELTFLGSQLTGVYSYGDLEANYQGFKLYSKMCMSESQKYLNQDSKGTWFLARKVDIKDYVNPNFDETFNLSYYVPKNWEKIRPVLQSSYCKERFSKKVRDRFSYYAGFNFSSESFKYIQELRSLGSKLTPNPYKNQSLDSICNKQSDM